MYLQLKTPTKTTSFEFEGTMQTAIAKFLSENSILNMRFQSGEWFEIARSNGVTIRQTLSSSQIIKNGMSVFVADTNKEGTLERIMWSDSFFKNKKWIESPKKRIQVANALVRKLAL
jgi:hypothetical protein